MSFSHICSVDDHRGPVPALCGEILTDENGCQDVDNYRYFGPFATITCSACQETEQIERTNIATFESIYRVELAQKIRQRDPEYRYLTLADVAPTVRKMIPALLAGRVSIASSAPIRRTCRRLKIAENVRSIQAFLGEEPRS